MGKTENRLIIHQYSKPGAVPVGGCSMEMLWHAVICFLSARIPHHPQPLTQSVLRLVVVELSKDHYIHAKWSYLQFLFFHFRKWRPGLNICTQILWYREVIRGISFYSKGNELTTAFIFKHSDKTSTEGTLSFLSSCKDDNAEMTHVFEYWT